VILLVNVHVVIVHQHQFGVTFFPVIGHFVDEHRRQRGQFVTFDFGQTPAAAAVIVVPSVATR
jgi:hypothetical protein